MRETRWGKARKKPIVIEFREPKDETWTFYPNTSEPVRGERIQTHEGTLCAIVGLDFIIKGVQGELYPIKKEIFYRTYDVVEEISCD
jgi:hypothetical protein